MTIRTESIAKPDGSDEVNTDYILNGSTKVWANLNGTGTIALRNSLNVSSVTDEGTGTYTLNYTNDFSSADYSVSSCATNGSNFHSVVDDANQIPLVGLVRVASYNSSNSLTDSTYSLFSIVGILA